LAKKLKRQGIPVVYLIAPQAWAWRQGRVRTMRATIQRLLCIFPFEEEFFRERGVPTSYIGHPLAGMVRPSMSRAEFMDRIGVLSAGYGPAHRSSRCCRAAGMARSRGICRTFSTRLEES